MKPSTTSNQKTNSGANLSRRGRQALLTVGIMLLAFFGPFAAHAHGAEEPDGLQCKTLAGGYSVCVYRSEGAKCVILRGDESNEIKCIEARANDQF